MLESLSIKNVALIDEEEITFGEGLNILTGETGAGKSMIIDSVNFALGERTGPDFIMRGAEQARVELLFGVDSPETAAFFDERGIPAEDGSIIISRTINQKGRTVNKINGQTVTSGMLKELSAGLIDIHGQHEHQSLINPAKHISILDKFCGPELEAKKAALEKGYIRLREVLKEIAALTLREGEREQRLDFLKFQITEIEDADLSEPEEEELMSRRRVLQNAEKIGSLCGSVLELIYDGGREPSAADKLSRALKHMKELCALDPGAQEKFDALESLHIELVESAAALRDYASDIETDPDALNTAEARLDLIYGLKRKYGGSVGKMMEYYENARVEYTKLQKSEENLESLTAEEEKLKTELSALCGEISGIRKEKADYLEQRISKELTSLEMKEAQFEIRVRETGEISRTGWDDVEFMISPNRGEELKPLAKIASGGEMSRVMLALKSVLAAGDSIDTFIFDEIDTGVSGRTAQKVGEKMALIARDRQILCVTHLSQIAAMADRHFLIEKKSLEDRTRTTVMDLTRDESINELARLLSGAKITEATRSSARELKEMAEKFKEGAL